MPVRSPRRRRRLARDWGPWLLVLALAWAAQLAWLHHRLGRPTWGEYWQFRGLYRPGIQAVDATGGDYLPAHVFHPLSPGGAKLAFVLAAGVYALAGTLLVWGAWRLSQNRRARVARSFRRALA